MDTFDCVAAAKANSGSPEEIEGLVSLLRKESAHGKACDRALLRRVAHQLADLCKQGELAADAAPSFALLNPALFPLSQRTASMPS